MALKDKMLAYALENGIPLLGVSGVEPFDRASPVLAEREKRGFLSGWEEKDVDLRNFPQRVMPGAKALISVAIPYFVPEQLTSAGDLSGRVSRSAWGKDYHTVLKQKLEGLMSFLSRYCPVKYRLMIDKGPLPDREAASRAGIGHFGKNCNIITRDYGSWVFLGQALIDLEIEPDAPAQGECGRCDHCIRACPTGALVAPYTLNATRCLSYITQLPGSIPREFRPLLGNRLYGCDFCQEVCPSNMNAKPGGSPDFYPEHDHAFPLLPPLIDMDEQDFRARWGLTSAAWRGRRNFIRNAVVALGNSGDDRAVPSLIKALGHPSPVIRGHAAWALGQIGGKDAKQALEQASSGESDPVAREEAVMALAFIGS
ncbi:MAG: tRNA epoxyqueuosine(34) reductase QueG [Bacillota bacterium]